MSRTREWNYGPTRREIPRLNRETPYLVLTQVFRVMRFPRGDRSGSRSALAFGVRFFLLKFHRNVGYWRFLDAHDASGSTQISSNKTAVEE